MADWIRAQLEFAGFFSYRVPGSSPSYALCSPVPSPAAVRLALVDAVIRHKGSVAAGRDFFQAVREARLELEPPLRIASMRCFLKRLKPAKEKGASVLESTGTREYCLMDGPLVVWVECEERQRVIEAFRWLRRLGTSDSLLTCTTGTGTPDPSLLIRQADGSTPTGDLAGRPVYALHELDPAADFDDVNPWAGNRRKSRKPFLKRFYILPLRRERAGENWVLYRRVPFTG